MIVLTNIILIYEIMFIVPVVTFTEQYLNVNETNVWCNFNMDQNSIDLL